MALIIECRGFIPSFGSSVFLAPNSTCIGEVRIEDYCSIWFQTVIRGDVRSIVIGKYTNIQDGTIIHGTYEKYSTVIEDNVSVGHGCIIHGCRIESHVLVGMGSIIMDNARIESYCIIGAGSLVLQNMICESGFLYAGSPVRKIKPISEEQKRMLDTLPQNYVLYSSWFD